MQNGSSLNDISGIQDHRLELLLDVIGRINTHQGLTSLLDTIMEACKTIMNAEAGSLMLLDSATKELIISVPTGPKKSDITGRRIPVGTGISGWVARHREPVIVNDVKSDSRFYGEVRTDGFTTRNLICVPLQNERGDLIGVMQAVNKGNNEDFKEDEIPLLMALANQAAICIEREHWHRKALDRERMDEQIKMARGIQTGFFPDTEPGIEHVDIAGSSHPAAYVGGDYYDYIKLGSQKWGIAVADVTGKGVPAAIMMATLRAQLHSLTERLNSVADTMEALNAAQFKEPGDDKYITMFYAILDGCHLNYVNAGHNPPIIYSPDDDSFEELSTGGPLLGFLDQPGYKEGSCELTTGQVLVMYTDGISEAEDENLEQFGEQRLKESIRKSADQDAHSIMENIINDVNRFRGNQPRQDDVTIVVLKITG